MRIKGFAKLTLLDYPGKLAATLFTGGCNLRCPFCHNSRLVLGNEPDINEEEIFSYLRKRCEILEGVVITGGEPLINTDIGIFINKIRSLGYSVKLDTNGCFPLQLERLIDAHLIDYVAMDIKNSREKYPETTGLPDFDITPIIQSVEILKKGKVDYEFRTTTLKQFHTKDDFVKIGEWLCGAPRYFIQGFKDSGELLSDTKMDGYSESELEEFVQIVAPFFGKTDKRC